MDEPVEDSLYDRAKALLEPGEVRLNGVIVETGLGTDQEPSLHQATLEVGRVIADAAGVDPDETYVYSGNDDDRFGVNQHQGRTIEEDAFVWECQQLLPGDTYVVVFYYEAAADQDAILEAVADLGYDVTGVEGG